MSIMEKEAAWSRREDRLEMELMNEGLRAIYDAMENVPSTENNTDDEGTTQEN